MILGLCGYARSGKDAAATILVEHFGFERRAFCDSLKLIGRDLGWDGRKTIEGRRLLEVLGTSVRVHLGPDVVLRPVLDHTPERLVISDVRRPDEARAIRRRGGQLWRIARPGLGPVNELDSVLDDWPVDRFISNHGNLDHLAVEVARALEESCSLS